MLSDQIRVDSFTEFVQLHEAVVRRALTAAFGSEAGRDAAAEAFAYGWRHWDRVREMDNPAGYLYRVGSNAAKKPPQARLVAHLEDAAAGMPWVEPRLAPALASLSEQQRTIVALVHSDEWTLGEVADLLGISKGTVQVHLRRAMKRLRKKLGA